MTALAQSRQRVSVQIHRSFISCLYVTAVTQIPVPSVLPWRKGIGSGLSMILGLPMAGYSLSWGRQEHPGETSQVPGSCSALQPLPKGQETPAKTWQKPKGSPNIPNFSSYRHKSTSGHTFGVLAILNWLLMHTAFNPSLLATVCDNSKIISFGVCFFPVETLTGKDCPSRAAISARVLPWESSHCHILETVVSYKQSW